MLVLPWLDSSRRIARCDFSSLGTPIVTAAGSLFASLASGGGDSSGAKGPPLGMNKTKSVSEDMKQRHFSFQTLSQPDAARQKGPPDIDQ